MDYQELTSLADGYKKILSKELEAKKAVADTATSMERWKVNAIRSAQDEGKIDGKNAEARAIQEKEILMNDKNLSEAIVAHKVTEGALSAIEIDRKHTEALMSLTKAWLYSQAGRLE